MLRSLTEKARPLVALFRGRGAMREETRSSAAALARVLQDRRALLKEALFSDEGALFNIANEFDIRHRGARGAHGKGQEDHADAFLDSMFWWHLATVELTDRLLVAQESTPHLQPTTRARRWPGLTAPTPQTPSPYGGPPPVRLTHRAAVARGCS